jgi:lipoyl(octanoyl) transferase
MPLAANNSETVVAAATPQALKVRHCGVVDYTRSWRNMQAFTDARTAITPDEVWLLEHPPVYTLGRNGKQEHLLDTGSIPVIRSDRGGQVTYHGPGQLVVYTLLDLKRRQLGVQSLVNRLEQAVIELLAEHSISAQRQHKAPGVYVDGRKIAALGLRVRKGCSFHGLSLNVNMDLTPFKHINPCGYHGLQVTQLADLGIDATPAGISKPLLAHLENLLQD